MKTILLVDDDQQVRSMFGVALRRYGYHVIEADSGVTGLALARQHLPDLILSDVHMPGGSGSTLLADIRLDPELKSKQVVLMTGRPDLVTPRRAMEDGADDFLLKPVSLDALRSCMDARFKRVSINWRVEDQVLAQLHATVPPQLPHECFTPLAGIIGLLEILLDGSAAFKPEEVADIHRDIYHSSLRLHRTLRNYLLILDLQAASTEPVSPLRADDVADAVRAGVKEVLRLTQRAEDVAVKIEPVSLAVKRDDLVRVVEELVDNACKFSRQGTRTLVEVRADGRLVVSDEGRGMSAEEIQHIGAFQQFDRKKNEQQGLGLGLVLVQKLAALSGATFHLASEPGKGTQVEVAFPLRPTSAKS